MTAASLDSSLSLCLFPLLSHKQVAHKETNFAVERTGEAAAHWISHLSLSRSHFKFNTAAYARIKRVQEKAKIFEIRAMKRPNTSGNPSAELLSHQTVTEEIKGRKKAQIYSREFQAMLDSLDQEEECGDELAPAEDKKRRLSSHQVKALEKNFEVETKLEPDRKAQLAEELGLQPRQVAIWFQNRRARYKTKQLERDYSILRASYDSLKLDFDTLEREKTALYAELSELKQKLHQRNSASCSVPAEDSPISDSVNNASLGDNYITGVGSEPSEEVPKEEHFISSSSFYDTLGHQMLSWIQFSGPRSMRIDEQQELFTAEEHCDFLSGDQAPTLHWYFP